jgi:Zn-dependent membrane protease YugP
MVTGQGNGMPEAIGILIFIISPCFISLLINYILRIIFRVNNLRGKQLAMTGKDVAAKFIGENDIHARIWPQDGILSDGYDPDENIIWLSNAVYYGCSPAAYAIALHETGHAIQHKEAFRAEQLRSMFHGFVVLFTIAAVICMGAWIIFTWEWALVTSIISLCAYLLIHIITVASEIDASRRAKEMLKTLNVSDEEFEKCKRMLGLAYWTYIITIISTLSVIILLLLLLASQEKDE